MKIGVLTLSLYANYGGNLQAYALITFLQGMGHEVWLINRERHKVTVFNSPFKLLKRFVRKTIFREDLITSIVKERSIIAKHSKDFIKKNIKFQTKDYNTTNKLKKGIKKFGFDAIVVGSDQVWRRKYIENNLTDYYLGFLSHNDSETRRISYAASFGISDWDYTKSETEVCSKLAKKFNAISVREYTGVELCKKKLDVDAQHVIDPTMLLDPEHYISLIDNPEQSFKGVLVYILDDSIQKKDIVDHVSGKTNLPIFKVNGNMTDQTIPAYQRVAPPIEDWIRGFRDASYIVTDSFHGAVFSILFNKPFLVIGNSSRGMARFESLLRTFNLESKLISCLNDINDDSFNSPDWNHINEIILEERKRARSFLFDALGKNN